MTAPILDLPLISVVIARRGRPAEVTATLSSVRGQEPSLRAGELEILLVLAPDEPESSDWTRQDDLRTIRAADAGLGAGRVAALAAARGRYLAVCDAGDRWAPDVLASLLPPFDNERVVLAYAIGQPSASGEDAQTGGTGDRRSILRETPACAVVVRTEAARTAGGYDPSLRAAADLDLWYRLGDRGRLEPVSGATASAIAARRSRGEDEVFAAEVAHLDRLDLRRRDAARIGSRFAERRAGARIEPFDPATWDVSPSGQREVIWHSQLRRTRSFGLVGRRLLLAVERQGISPLLTPFSGEIPPDLGRFVATPAHWSRLAFLYDPIAPAGAPRVERLVRYATWETTDVPRWEVEAINRHVALLCVPSRRNREDALAAGVNVPIHVLPHGVDPTVFSYLNRPTRETYTFGTFGELSPRKGVDVLLRSFRIEFRPDEPVRLLIKGVKREPDPPLPDWAVEDARVVYRGGRVAEEELLAILGEFDVCVLPTRGEAFGLCGLEAMATGLPLIATDWSGPADYLDPADSLPLGYRLVEAGGVESNDVRYFGRWAEPDEGHLGELLRWCYENRVTAAAMGQVAADRVVTGWTWDLAAARLARLLDAVAAGVSPA